MELLFWAGVLIAVGLVIWVAVKVYESNTGGESSTTLAPLTSFSDSVVLAATAEAGVSATASAEVDAAPVAETAVKKPRATRTKTAKTKMAKKKTAKKKQTALKVV